MSYSLRPNPSWSRLGVALAALVTLGLAPHLAAASDCEAARCAVQAAINQNCPCDSATNHGRYVSCVAHQVKSLVPVDCKGKVTRCAARSTCGKAGFVTCTRQRLGTCNLTTGTCVEDPTVVCSSDANCVLGTTCSIKRDSDHCTAAGGSVGTSSTCCASCTVTP
jgi:hypothetical protein